jgi:hypothetical protein
MPEKLKNYKERKQAYANTTGGKQRSDNSDQNPMNFQPMQQQPMPMIQISSLTDIMALGGFNPNKYLSPQPLPFTPNQFYSANGSSNVPPHMMNQQAQMPSAQFGNPQPFNGQQPKKNGNADKKKGDKGKKGDKQEKKYVSKQPQVSPQKAEVEVKQ